MPNITITLLLNKRTRQTIDALDVNVVAQAGGYSVVEGESNVTEIEVAYPSVYIGQNFYVHMKNARGEYKTLNFSGSETVKKFKLPAEMTYAGNTILTFYATSGSGDSAVKTVWFPVVVPITATGVNYTKVAMASIDVLEEMISAETARASAETTRVAAENARASAEASRVAAETSREKHEIARASAEASRVAEYDNLIKGLEDAIVNINAAAENASKVQEIYDQMQITLTYDDEGYPCYVDTTEEE